ncbi:radical SAM family heme chaperone HemW [Stieleria marina]|uniref:Heme chaperone HemW n=1 Tax=Stieleria marina TaxID=1930275 RepID=A0A517NT91_9BACT|nr:Oxygen-independent coproporphyrinogen-III oxidase-like protein [Planctomycetes bacterium K23_9]
MSDLANSDIAEPDQPPAGWPAPRSAYIHVPFCRHRCGYCNFSVVAQRDDLIQQYLESINAELAGLGRPEVDTVFIGGGTPTHLATPQLQRLMQIVEHRFAIQPNVEWSMEANPEDISAEKLAVMRDSGVNRLSLGVQSFSDGKLQLLERSHRGIEAEEIIQLAAGAIPNISIDLIFAAPKETLAEWTEDLQKAFSLPIAHLSTYALTYEKGTSFWTRARSGNLSAATEQLEVDMYNAARQAAKQSGWEHYEISNFAKSESQCRHNLAYWHGRGWYAAGPGAASFVGGHRNVNHRSTTTYLKRMAAGQDPVAESEAISTVQYARELAAFGIRMLAGIDVVKLSRETGVDLGDECRLGIEEATRHGWLAASDGRMRLTQQGVLFADSVAACFLSD